MKACGWLVERGGSVRHVVEVVERGGSSLREEVVYWLRKEVTLVPGAFDVLRMRC